MLNRVTDPLLIIERRRAYRLDKSPKEPVQLAQGLLWNMLLPYAKATEALSGTLTETREDGFAMLVPIVLETTSFNLFSKL